MVSTASSKPERIAGARVCSVKAGWKLGTLGGPCSTGSGDWAPAAQARSVVEATRPARRGMAALLVEGSARSTGRRGQRSVTPARGGRPRRRGRPEGQARSKRSAFITFVQAAMKSWTNFSPESDCA